MPRSLHRERRTPGSSVDELKYNIDHEVSDHRRPEAFASCRRIANQVVDASSRPVDAKPEPECRLVGLVDGRIALDPADLGAIEGSNPVLRRVNTCQP